MNRSYLILLFAASLFLVMIGWGLYGRWKYPQAPPATTQPTTRPLVERLRAERERRLSERGDPPAPDESPATTTQPAPAVLPHSAATTNPA